MVLDLEEIRKNPKFNASQFLNKILADSGGNIATILTELEAEVEEAIAQANSNIKNVAQKMTSDLPKVARELDITQKEILRLQEDVKTGLSEAQNVQKKTTASMSTLEKLDSMKTKVLATSVALQEADKWSDYFRSIEQLLDSGDVNKSYECILGMEKSLSVLNPEQAEERRLILEEMKNRLEALATKHLVLAFDTNNIENAKYFFTMFVNLNRMEQYVKYFQNSEKLKLSQEWRKFVETLSFKQASVKFYDCIMDHWHSKLPWCKIIFADEEHVNPFNVLIDLYTETLRTLEPSLLFCFESETKKQPFIDVLIHFNQSTDRFVQNVKQLVETQGVSTDASKIENLLKICFTPFLTQYEKYAKYHEMLIYGKIQAATVAVAASSNETTSILQERTDSSKRLLAEIILHIKEGEEKVKIFNRGFGYLHFGKGLNSGLERFASWNQDIYRFMENSVESTAEGQSHRNALENVLGFTELCGEALRQIVKLDQTLSANCARVFGKNMKEHDGNPLDNLWNDRWSYYLDNQLRVEILQFVQKKETLLGKAVTHIKKLCRDATQLVQRVTAEPILNQLAKNFSVGDSSLKEAIPQEYITQMGEFLMLLPQNLEPFIISENSSISYAFDQTSEEVGRSPIDFILTSLATSICETYADKILKLTFLTDGQAKQLGQDIDYLASVLEDLGLKPTSDLPDISKLLKNFSNLEDPAVTEKVSPRILTRIRRMKHPVGN